MSNSRIPRKIADFNNYVRNSDDYLQLINPLPLPPTANWQRLGLVEASADQWHQFRIQWDLLYTQYSSSTTRTKAVNAEVASAMDEFRQMAQPLLNVIAASLNATDTDATALNFKIGRSEPTHPTEPISTQCYLKLVNLGGAMVKFLCLTAEGNKRVALPDEANAVMIAYKFGENPPVSPNDGTEVAVITRASDMKSLGIEHRGERLHMFARFYNTHYPEFAGPWSDVTSIWL